MPNKPGYRLLIPLFAVVFLFSMLIVTVTATDEPARELYFVVLKDEPLPRYYGDIPGYPATRADLTNQDKFSADTPASRHYANYLADRRATFTKNINSKLDINLDIVAEFSATFNGLAVQLTKEEAATLATHPAVAHIEKEMVYTPTTDAGPEWVNSNPVWQGLGGITATRGAGVVIGIMDTGIDPWNPSFADLSGDGYDHENPLGSGNYLGVCDPSNTDPKEGVVAYDPTFPCNDKLIGVWGFTNADASPRDMRGHGSHVAATAAGNVVTASINTSDGPYEATIMGVAPQANLIVYDVCNDNANRCYSLAQQLAWEQIILDGVVDVVNYSIGSPFPTYDVWNNVSAQAWLSLREAGIFVATSAGNWGPNEATVGSPADLPWITAVGASSHNRAFSTTLSLSNVAGDQLDLFGLSQNGGLGLNEIVFAADYVAAADFTFGFTVEDVARCSPGIFPPGTFSGQIVICERDGIYSRVSKGQTVSYAGGSGLILVQPEPFAGGPGALAADNHVIPAVHVSNQSYQQLQNFYQAAPSQNISGSISVSQVTFDPMFGNQMARFSSQGPGQTFENVLVPALSAPGQAILSAGKINGTDGNSSYRLMSGTSMSSPHVAGAAALLIALYPTWTPQEIASALQLTARPVGMDPDGLKTATAFDQGSGQLDVAAAAAAGIIMDIDPADFRALNPAVEGRAPSTLNNPSLVAGACQRLCRWERTLRNPTDQTITWTATLTTPVGSSGTISPAVFSLAAGEFITVEISFAAGILPYDSGWVFGEVVLEPDKPQVSTARLPLAAYPIDFQYRKWFPIVDRSP